MKPLSKKTPANLVNEAREFWLRNAKHCEDNGTLTDQTRDSFVLLCLIWSKFTQADADGLDTFKLISLGRQVQSMMKPFGLIPENKKPPTIKPPVAPPVITRVPLLDGD